MSRRTNLKVLLTTSVFSLAVLGACGSVQADPPGSNSPNPNGSGNRYATFQLINGVAIYGG